MLAVGGAAFMGGLLGTLYALQQGGAGAGLVAPCTTPGGGGGDLPADAPNFPSAGDKDREPSSGQHQQAGGNTHPSTSSSSEAGAAAEGRDAAAVSPLSHSGGGASVGPRGGAALATGRGFNVDARMRVQWQEITGMCNRRNYTSCRDVDRSGWTDVAQSTFSELEFAGLGAWSTFKVRG